ncbi:hypothetical protein I7I50_05109 [Histoplasma capsulatum G186AR]|uniref:Uncharacterized protein n=1 Tax=Ajellomyces capsulatus TaxID=5037 RepID=A0A8H8D7W7_AJECA|nr:hypothetical protein I7I52_03367 [Histoplasma capsulatum]QSS75835.1 hypothetical protein I7I50_05109 [Histoplasma capsulatum G186AR]
MACEFYKSPEPLSWDVRDYLEFPSCSALHSIASIVVLVPISPFLGFQEPLPALVTSIGAKVPRMIPRL